MSFEPIKWTTHYSRAKYKSDWNYLFKDPRVSPTSFEVFCKTLEEYLDIRSKGEITSSLYTSHLGPKIKPILYRHLEGHPMLHIPEKGKPLGLAIAKLLYLYGHVGKWLLVRYESQSNGRAYFFERRPTALDDLL